MNGCTLFSGIGAPETAAPEIGWRYAAEIDTFASAVLAHRYPHIPNLGDITDASFTDRARSCGPVDLLVAGSPCQDFSLAGRRGGMAGGRGSLALRLVELIDQLRPRWLLFENVPGLVSSWSHLPPCAGDGRFSYVADEGSDFGAFLDALAGIGREGICWGMLDAQYFGLAQRRERLFVVAGPGDWRDAAAVLFDRECLSGNPVPRRETREDLAGTPGGGSGERGWPDDTDRTTFVACGGNNTGGPIDVATACNAKGGSERMDFETETLIVPALPSSYGTGGFGHNKDGLLTVAHTLCAEGFDAMEDGTGRGIPLVTHALDAASMGQCTEDGTGRSVPLIAFTSKDYGGDANEEIAPTLRAMPHDHSHANAGGPPAVAFTERTRPDGRSLEAQEELAYALTNPGSGGRAHSRQIMASAAVRRLTPRECERLMGLPDDYTLIPTYRKRAKERGAEAEALYEYYCRTAEGRAAVEFRDGCVYATPDGPRYRALGNSMAVPVMRWLIRRIREVDALLRRPE
jgi:DNA (cytosine-5)-methyltransferase 1